MYLKDNDFAGGREPKPLTADQIPSDAMSHTLDPDSARRLWELSGSMLRS